jgi:hypothetical protein
MLGMRKNIGVSDALSQLRPGSQWSVRDEDYDQIDWLSEDIEKPTREEVEQKIKELKDNEGMTAVREIRDWYLQQSDWTQGQDIRLIRGEHWCQSWDEYRQKLRDITSSRINPYFDEYDILHGVVWPEKPNV